MHAVLYDEQGFTHDKRGGIAKYFAQLGTGIENHNIRPIFPFIFCVNQHYFELGGRDLIKTPEFTGSARIGRLLNRCIGKRSRNHDLWHSTYYNTDMLNFFNSTRMVMTIHDMTPEIMPNLFASNPHEGKREYAMRARRIIAVSENTKNDITKIYGTAPSQIDVIHHGIDIRERHQSEVKLPDHFILYTGSRAAYKNFGNLLFAFKSVLKRFPELHLVCIGSPFKKEEVSHIQNLGLKNIVQIRATDAQLRYAMKKAALFVYPSLYEGFGIPILEAMHQSCPLVLADASCFPEIAKDAAAYFDPLDPESIAEAIISTILDIHKSKFLAERGQKLIREFSVEKMLKRTSDLYKIVIEELGKQ